MTRLKRAFLTAFAVSTAVSLTTANRNINVVGHAIGGMGIWRVNPTTGYPENIDNFCTLTTTSLLCDVVYPSAIRTIGGSSIYFTSQQLFFEFPIDRVYLKSGFH